MPLFEASVGWSTGLCYRSSIAGGSPDAVISISGKDLRISRSLLKRKAMAWIVDIMICVTRRPFGSPLRRKMLNGVSWCDVLEGVCPMPEEAGAVLVGEREGRLASAARRAPSIPVAPGLALAGKREDRAALTLMTLIREGSQKGNIE